MGEGPIAIIPLDVRAKLNKAHGEMVAVKITLDTAEREIDMPPELIHLLTNNRLQKAFNSMSYTKRKEMARGISSAKREETKHKRLAAALVQLQELVEGKR